MATHQMQPVWKGRHTDNDQCSRLRDPLNRRKRFVVIRQMFNDLLAYHNIVMIIGNFRVPFLKIPNIQCPVFRIFQLIT